MQRGWASTAEWPQQPNICLAARCSFVPDKGKGWQEAVPDKWDGSL